MHRRHFLAGLGVSASVLSACQTASTSTARSPNSKAQTLSETDLEDAVVGSTYLGCGGGGTAEEARGIIAADLSAGHSFTLLSTSDLQDTDQVASPYGLGSLAPPGGPLAEKLAALEAPIEAPTLAAFRVLERRLGTRFAGVVLGELGPGSMAEGLSIAARLGIPALDADTVGRATPEINQHSVRVAGYALTPAAAVTQFGDEVVLERVVDPARQEDVFRSLAVGSGVIGVTDGPITGAEAKTDGTLVTGSFTLARRIGAAVRVAREAGQDPIEAARVAGNGFTLFRGQVSDFEWGDRDGFLAGNVILEGAGPDAGGQLYLDYKNEHLVARRDGPGGAVIATCPDLITLISEETYEGIANPEFRLGQSVRVLGFRCDPIWRQPAGLSVFEPRYFGYDIDYVPIEERLA